MPLYARQPLHALCILSVMPLYAPCRPPLAPPPPMHGHTQYSPCIAPTGPALCPQYARSTAPCCPPYDPSTVSTWPSVCPERPRYGLRHPRSIAHCMPPFVCSLYAPCVQDGLGHGSSSSSVIVLFACVMALPGTLGFSLLLLLFNLQFSALASFLGFAMYLTGALHLAVTKKPWFAMGTFVYGTTVGVLLVQLSFGGGPAAGGVLGYAHLGALGLVVLDPSKVRRSAVLLAGMMLVSLGMCVVDLAVGLEYLTPQRRALPQELHALMCWFNDVFSGFATWCIMSVSSREAGTIWRKASSTWRCSPCATRRRA